MRNRDNSHPRHFSWSILTIGFTSSGNSLHRNTFGKTTYVGTNLAFKAGDWHIKGNRQDRYQEYVRRCGTLGPKKEWKSCMREYIKLFRLGFAPALGYLASIWFFLIWYVYGRHFSSLFSFRYVWYRLRERLYGERCTSKASRRGREAGVLLPFQPLKWEGFYSEAPTKSLDEKPKVSYKLLCTCKSSRVFSIVSVGASIASRSQLRGQMSV